MTNMQGPMRILFLPLPLIRNSAERDWDNILELWHARTWFTHLLIVTRAWQETPDAIHHHHVQIAVALAEHFNLGVIWGRNLWVAWPSDKLDAPMPDAFCYMDSQYYTAAIATVKAEARSLGAVGTMLDAEPYGQSANKELLRSGRGFMPAVAGNAIKQATSVTGPVDFITPTSSMIPSGYQWSMAGLGKRMDQKTYKGKTANFLINAKPPEGGEHKVHVWGHWVGENTLSPADVKAFDMDKVRERFPECIGQFVYADKLADTLKGWNG